MVIFISLLVAIIGVIIYLAFNNKLSEVGKIMFAVGLLAFLLQLGPRALSLLR